MKSTLFLPHLPKFSPCFLHSSWLSLGLNTLSDPSSPTPPPQKKLAPPSVGPPAASFSWPQISPWILPHLLSDTSLLLIIFFFQTHLSLAWHFTPALAFPLPSLLLLPQFGTRTPPQPAHGGSVTVALPGQGTAGPASGRRWQSGRGVGPGPARRGRSGAEGPSRQRPALSDTSILWHPSSSRRG